MDNRGKMVSQNYPYLLIMCGLPSSGKTTISRKVASVLEDKHGVSAMVISSDDFRRMVSHSSLGFKPEREMSVKTLYEKALATGLEHGFLVISDDLNYYKSMRSDIRHIAKRADADYDIILVDTPAEQAIEWNQKRGTPIPAELIEEINQKFDPPKGDYKWDTPLAVVNPAKQNIDEIADLIVAAVLKRLESPKRSKPKKVVENEKSLRARGIERETRKSMMEVMTRYKNPDLGISLSRIRKEVVKKALADGLKPVDAVELFHREANAVAKSYTMEHGKDLIPVHVGLFGHVDHGKTMLARQLTEKPSTAALDKAPDSVRRGMTLDMGFSAFNLGQYLVTLVDLPGHFSLVRHVVAGANIIDAAVLIVAADLGLQVQSAEHFSIIKNLGIKDLVVALNKVDLASPKRVEEVKNKITLLLKGTPYENAKIVEVSGLTGKGIDDLKSTLQNSLNPPIRQWTGPFKMPIDHAFTIAGAGTVLTGTIHRGKVKLKDAVEIKPIDKKGQVRSIRSFGEDKKEAAAGERVGIAVKDIKPDDAHRGYVAVSPGSITSTCSVITELEVDKYYKRSLTPYSDVDVFVGSYEMLGNVMPGVMEDGKFVVKKSVKTLEKCLVYIELRQQVVAERGDHILLMNPGLQTREFRIIGGGRITQTNNKPEFFSKKTKQGTVKQKSAPDEYAVHGLFAASEAARRFVGKTVVAASGIKGEIKAPLSSGEVLVKFKEPVPENEKVFLHTYKKLKGK
ncbi:MAG: selenocysteine-specific translation elongation factor [Candidatus Bathyarchaeota archaeon]|nr:selenocysteine-specific translation elongation factor [Candidatus Bathyarchaeota archaeon]